MEPVAIIGSIHLTPMAFELFVQEQGKQLVSDVNYILTNRKIEDQRLRTIEEFSRTRPSLAAASEFFKKASPAKVLRDTPAGYLHAASDELVIQYDPKSRSLFYLYVLDLRNPDDMNEVPSFKVLQTVARYKDIDSVDYVAFSSSATNFLTDPIWRTFTLEKGKWKATAGDSLDPATKGTLDRLSRAYYFDAIHKSYDKTEPALGTAAPWAYPHHYFPPVLLKHITVPSS